MRVCIPGSPTTIGGPESFKRKLAKGLNDAGVEVTFDKDSRPYDVVLIVAVTRNLRWLRDCKKQGIPVIHRLDGFHWYSRRFGVTSKRRWHESLLNRMMRIVHDHFADFVVYQSHFIAQWWHREHGKPRVPFTVIHNGVDIELFSPVGDRPLRNDGISLVSVEGSFAVHERVFRTPLDTWSRLNSKHNGTRLHVLGDVPERFRRLAPESDAIEFNTVSNWDLPYYLRGATAFVSAEINPPCPNSVIEALACGTPVVGYATGSLPELVSKDAGICVDYGGDPWKLEKPDVDALANAVEIVHSHYESYSEAARQTAIERYSLQQMVSRYVEVFETAMKSSRRHGLAETLSGKE